MEIFSSGQIFKVQAVSGHESMYQWILSASVWVED